MGFGGEVTPVDEIGELDRLGERRGVEAHRDALLQSSVEEVIREVPMAENLA